MNKLRIAQIAPLWESVPPSKYGAVEYLISLLCDHLVQKGHSVTLFASGDSKTKAFLEPICDESLNKSQRIIEPEIYRMIQFQKIRQCAENFDIIHSHIHSNSGCFGIPILSNSNTKVLHTLHLYCNEDNRKLFEMFAKENFIAISNAQKISMPKINFLSTIHHGIDVRPFPFRNKPHSNKFVAFLGRIRPEKGVHLAIKAAQKAGIQLKIAGRIKKTDQQYFNEVIKPLIDDKLVQYIGELNFINKCILLSEASALLVPVTLEEPFGLVLIEAMACGTPVIAFRRGAIPEIVINNETGFIVDSVDEMAEKIFEIDKIDRNKCRKYVTENFNSDLMVERYLEVYYRLLIE